MNNKEKIIESIIDELHPNTYTDENAIWDRLRSGLRKMTKPHLSNLGTLMLSMQIKPHQRSSISRQETTNIEIAPENLNIQYPCDRPDIVSEQIRESLPICTKALIQSWTEGEIGECKTRMTIIKTILLNAEKVIKNNLWNNLR
jgi:hypothetical protein